MENRFNNRDFEQFVKQNADQYRMFPSDKVWKGIHNTLHVRRRWYGIGLTLLLLTTGAVTWVMLSLPGKNRQVVSTMPKVALQQPVAEKKQNADVIIVPAKVANNKASFITSTDNFRENLYIDNTPVEQPSSNEAVNTISEPPVIVYLNPIPVIKVEPVRLPESIVKTTPPARQINYNQAVMVPAMPVEESIAQPSSIADNTDIIETAAFINDDKMADKKDSYPLSIESVINSYQRIGKKKNISVEAYFTPTISYRALRENKVFINTARNASNGTANATYSTDVNSVVTHKPDVGLQLGFSGGYPLTRDLKLIGGLQFNVSKYNIRAYTHPSEVTTIALSTAAGGTNTFSTMTTYRNAGGYKANWLHNLYFSLSAPIGLELKLAGKAKSYFGVSGTVQPTYVLSNRAYLISTDYKNYAEVPSLTRKWNVNSSFELFAGYSTGKLNWRIGPQVSYQTMSSFQNKYPVKEHLFDFGLKMGVMLK